MPDAAVTLPRHNEFIIRGQHSHGSCAVQSRADDMQGSGRPLTSTLDRTCLSSTVSCAIPTPPSPFRTSTRTFSPCGAQTLNEHPRPPGSTRAPMSSAAWLFCKVMQTNIIATHRQVEVISYSHVCRVSFGLYC